MSQHASFTQRGVLRNVEHRRAVLMIACLLTLLASHSTRGQEAQWIWSPERAAHDVPVGGCLFRKTFAVASPDRGVVSITAHGAYELYVNGRVVGVGQAEGRLVQHDISSFLARGRNVIAIKATSGGGNTAGVAARVHIKQGTKWQSYSTDDSWRTSLRPAPRWNAGTFDDSGWRAAVQLGQLGDSAPRTARTGRDGAAEAQVSDHRFEIADEFSVEPVLEGKNLGSLISLACNQFGHLLAGQEEGPLLLISGSDGTGVPSEVRVYCDKVKNCQGILAVGESVYVTAEGPNGAALYRLEDDDRNGSLEKVTPLIQLGAAMGEHGPHGLSLGPDGMIYVVVGNQSDQLPRFAATSPHANYYEGDLLRPRYEDPAGHAAGRKVPGGLILRTDLEGNRVELFAGGLRNPYDLAFDRRGNLFVHDSDMESDIGTSWYRPTRLYHVTAGGEYGWRSGWAKWPEYFVDALPEILDTGRGSPSGAVCYDHFTFPTRYHGALFLADWSEGRILCVTIEPRGASFSASAEVFLQGRPLNVTGLDVGPDGAVYFATGGRGTEGGVYRIYWKGRVPEAVQDLGGGISAAIRHPQLAAAWSRRNIDEVRQSLGDDWGRQLRGVANSTSNPWYYRTRALDLMQLLGPPPPADLLIQLARDDNENLRGKAAALMGVHATDETRQQLVTLLADADAAVRRQACEALVRSQATVPLESLIPLLASDDRAEAWAARRLLERQPVDQWRDELLSSKQHRLVIQGGLALMVAHPTVDHARAVLSRFQQLLDEFITDRDFVDLLRLAQVALHRGPVSPELVPELAWMLGEEFPSRDERINRELTRLLAYLQVSEPMPRYLAFLRSEEPGLEKLHLAMQLRFLEAGWAAGQKLELIRFFEEAKSWGGGTSFARYVGNVQRDMGRLLTPAEGREILASGQHWPDAAVGVLFSLPAELGPDQVQALAALDRNLESVPASEATKSLRTGILALLARSGDDASMEHLRQVWDEYPERRESVAICLARRPAGENWPYLIKSLPILRGNAAHEVLRRLAMVDEVPAASEAIRQVILRGLELEADGALAAAALLEHWTGEAAGDADGDGPAQLQSWQAWFARRYPDQPAADLPVADSESRWDFGQLLNHLSTAHDRPPSTAAGAEVFVKAQCANCHRFGDSGEALGPDLTALGKRFTRREVLESIVYPSHVISDQYAGKRVVTTSGQVLTGLVSPTSDGAVVVLQPDGEKVHINTDEIEQVSPSRNSVMPARLLENLELDEISDLFAFLGILPAGTLAQQPGEQRR